MPAQLQRWLSGETIRTPDSPEYPLVPAAGPPEYGKIVRDVAAQDPGWTIGHYSVLCPPGWGTSGRLWTPAKLTVSNIAGITDCPAPNGQAAAAALNGQGPVELSQYQAPGGDWGQWTAVLNGWTIDVSDPGGVGQWLTITKLIAGTTWTAYDSQPAGASSDIRPGPYLNVASVIIPGWCGAPAGLGGTTVSAHGGQLDVALGP